MILVLAIASLALGITIACLAERHPRHRQFMQTLGGVLLIAGLAVLGHLLDTRLALAHLVTAPNR
jgi:VIT1/CCC1 family predicted Fe2+/Mn2+ transporter